MAAGSIKDLLLKAEEALQAKENELNKRDSALAEAHQVTRGFFLARGDPDRSQLACST